MLNRSLKLVMCSSNVRSFGIVFIHCHAVHDIRARNTSTASFGGIFRTLTYARKSVTQSSASRLLSELKRGGIRALPSSPLVVRIVPRHSWSGDVVADRG